MSLDTPIQRATQYSKSGTARLKALQTALTSLDVRGLVGDVVECGVWRGGSIILARLVSPARCCWLLDTFAGMTAPTPLDTKRDGFSAVKKFEEKQRAGEPWMAVGLEDVKKNLQSEGVYDERLLRFVVGDICVTLDEHELPEKIALLRLDTDWHASTKKELEVLWPRVVPGGILIVDDYNHWMGARKAVDEYFGAKDRTRLKPIDYTAVSLVKS